MKKCLFKNDFIENDIIEELGINLLKGITPIVLDGNGEIYEKINYSGEIDLEKISVLNSFSRNIETDYISLEIPSATFIYDLLECKVIDKIVICGFHNGENDYSLLEYELFISDSIDTLFNDENKIITYNNAGLWEHDATRNHCDQEFDLTDYKGRYFALKILKSNTTDDIIRISTIGLYNNKLTEELTFVKKTFGINAIKGVIPSAIGSYTADLTYLTDGICFRDDRRVRLNAETKYIFKLEQELKISGIGIVSSYNAINNCKIYIANKKDLIWESENTVEYEEVPHPTSVEGVAAAELIFADEIVAKYIGIEFSTPEGYIDQITVKSTT